MITEAARDRFSAMVQAAVRAGARVVAGGTAIPGHGWFYAPTVLLAETPEPEEALAGAFGPVLLVRGVADPDRAVAAANATQFALGASVWGKESENGSVAGSSARSGNGLRERGRDADRPRRRALRGLQGQWVRANPRSPWPARVYDAQGLL